MKLRSLLLAATILAVPAAVQAAEPVNGVYVSLGAGFDYLNTVNGKNLVFAAPIPGNPGNGLPVNSANLTSNGGWAVLGSVGYGLGNGVRLEVEGNFRQNHTRVGNSVYVGGGANYQQYGVMANALYDFTNVAPWVDPYIGIGFGYVQNALQNGAIYSTTLRNQATVNFTDSAKGSAAGQLILGAAFPIAGVPGLAITTEFRFIGQFADQTYQGRTTLARPVAGGLYGTSLKLAAPTNEDFLIGLRYAFNAAPPPPPPAPAPIAAPAPAPARTYLVFFDWDRADLSGRARQIIAEAAQASTHVQLTQIEVSGYADRTGTAQYNLGLSRRRADNVAAELVRLGVPKNVIAIQAFGDTHLLVPTGPGVREPQNRRVEIVLK
jgi:outer membrane protein OmpA-like peptidoglycan-associated protein